MTRVGFLLALLLVSAGGLRAYEGPVPQSQASLDLAGYQTELIRWSAAVEELKKQPKKAAELRRQLPRCWRVAVDGQQFEVSTAWLDTELSAAGAGRSREAVERIQARLSALWDEALPLGRDKPVDHAAAQRSLDSILQRSEFRSHERPSWFLQVQRVVGRWISKAAEALKGRLQARPRAAEILLWSLALALVLASLAWLARWLLYRTPGLSLDLRTTAPTPNTGEKLAGDALAAARRENYRQAIRLAYWAGVQRMAESGAWEVNGSRTPREYLRLLGANHPQRRPLSSLTARFEQTWYGTQAASSEHFRDAWAQVEELECLSSSTPATVNS